MVLANSSLLANMLACGEMEPSNIHSEAGDGNGVSLSLGPAPYVGSEVAAIMVFMLLLTLSIRKQ